VTDTPAGGFRLSGALLTRAVVGICGLVALACLLLVVASDPALAAFPGRNGLLVVQPTSGLGLIVVGANGRHARQLCVSSIRCEGATDPEWSPDGSEIVFAAAAPESPNPFGIVFQGPPSSPFNPAPFVVYADGSCFACAVPPTFADDSYPAWDPQNDPVFLPEGELEVSLDEYGAPPAQLGSVGVDGIGFEPFDVSNYWRQPAWSAHGQLAAVRMVRHRPEVFLIDPATGSTRQLTYGGADSPDWSPDGRRLAVVHADWIEIIGVRGRGPRRLVRGSAPAWSPDGRELAFIGAHSRVLVTSARESRPRPVGKLRGVDVDWQPLTGRRRSSCQPPPGSTVLADSADAIVTARPPPSQVFVTNQPSSFLGCLKSAGRERLLETLPEGNQDNTLDVTSVALAGDYAAFANLWQDPHYGGLVSTVVVFDLRTGAVIVHRGGETINGELSSLDQLVLGPDGVTAAHTSFTDCVSISACTTTEQIVANDSAGTRTLDTATAATPYQGGTPSLTRLTLTGDTLTWDHDGSQRSTQLHG
jgi:dipeptidyl aminopeptidase/acylaminoacyl peptidase